MTIEKGAPHVGQSMTRYAKVIINLDAPLESSFHYHLPADLEEAVQAGHLVEVEFGRRLAQGIVIGFDDQSPVPETKPIIGLVMPDPVLSAVQLDLAAGSRSATPIWLR